VLVQALSTNLSEYNYPVTLTNSGTVTVSNGGQLTVGSFGTFSDTSGATVGVAVNGTTGTGGISGGTIGLAGTLRVTTVGSPSGGTFTPIQGSLSGTFATVSSGAHTYSPSYSSTAVRLTFVS